MKNTSGILLLNKKTKKVLILRSYKNWGIPKGIIDKNENIWDTAKRELKEETNINILKLNGKKKLLGSEIYKNGKKRIIIFLFTFTNDLPDVKLSFEHHAYKWTSLEEAIKVVHEAQKKILQKIKL